MIADPEAPLSRLVHQPVAGADPSAPRPRALHLGRPRSEGELTRTRRLLFARGLLDAVEPVALLSVPGGWRLFALHGDVPSSTAASLLVVDPILHYFAKDYGTVECVLAPRGAERSESVHPDHLPQRPLPPGPWTKAVTVRDPEHVPTFALPPPISGLSLFDWLEAMPGNPASGVIDPAGLEPWDPARPGCLAWATPGARAACGGRLPTGRLIPQGDLCIVGLWDCGDASGYAFHYVSRRGPHAVLLRVPWYPIVPDLLRGSLPALKGNLERVMRWRREFQGRLQWSRLVIDLRYKPWPGQGLMGTVQIAARVPADVVLRTRTVHLKNARAAWWQEVTGWVRKGARGSEASGIERMPPRSPAPRSSPS